MTPTDAFEFVDSNDALQLLPRHKRPRTDDLVLRVFHRTTGAGRSVLLAREDALRLYGWLGRWLDEGWDGVPKVTKRELDEVTGQ